MIESISEQQQTRLGPGYFVTWVTTYVEAGRGGRSSAIPDSQVQPEGGVTGWIMDRSAMSLREEIRHPRPSAGRTIRVGDDSRPLGDQGDGYGIVAGAMATRDFMPVHHERDYANAQGAPDIFMNILSDTATAAASSPTGPDLKR